jgi:ketosteroid isomerase-like protein
MFDVPPPFESLGLAAYEGTWRLFYSSRPDPVAFDIKWLEVVAGDDVAFAFAHMQCVEAMLRLHLERFASHAYRKFSIRINVPRERVVSRYIK